MRFPVKLGVAILAWLVVVLCPGRARSDVAPAELGSQAEAAFRSGTIQLRNGDYQAAANAFQQVLKIDKNFGPAYLNLGLALNGLKKYAEAIPAFAKALELDPRLEGAALFLGIDYCKTGDPEKAIAPLRKAIALAPGDSDVHLWLGKALLSQDLYQEAIPHLETAAKADPKDLDLQYALAQAHLFLSDQMTQKIYEENPHTYWPRLLKAQAYALEGKLDLALIQYSEVTKLSPNIPGVHEAMGGIYVKKRDYANAEAEFHQELAINPYAFTAVCSLGDVLIMSGKAGEAVPALEKITAQKPSLGCAHYELGRAWFRQGKYEDAAGHLKAATALNPKYAPAYILLGQCYSKLGKSDLAQAAFRTGRSLDEEHLQRMQQNSAPLEEAPEQLNPQ